jgi:uncharacterized phage protein (TIGR01671 family)
MRTVKFRVWNENEKRMINFRELNKSLCKITIEDGSVKVIPMITFAMVIEGGGFVLQQFTGLYDGDKEIYEGDIVQVKMYDDWDDEVGFDVTYGVAWCNIHVGWRGFTAAMKKRGSSGIGLPSPIKIVGNIFENPELLK